MNNLKTWKNVIIGSSLALTSAVGCQVMRDRGLGTESMVSEFGNAQNCGMLVTVGENTQLTNVDGQFGRLPSAVSIAAQIVACGSAQSTAGENWHAIGVGVERQSIMIQDRASGTTQEAQPVLDAAGNISLYAGNQVVMKLGSAATAQAMMPVGLDSGLTFEIRVGTQKVELSTAKTLPAEQMVLWVVK